MNRQGRAVRTRHALIRAAAEVFAEEGFPRASLRAISDRAGVSSGALHFHFAHKRQLAEAVEASMVLRRITETAWARQGDCLQAVVDATQELMRCLARDPVARAGFELARDVTCCASSPLHGQWQHWVEECLRRAERDGVLGEGVSSADAARAIVAATVGFQVLGRGDELWLSPRSVMGFWGLLLPRLTGEPGPDGLMCAGSGPPASGS
ncbi:ScbR family autoregulator-binding transcription factor [Streptomyces sp. NPDC058092]|uniref:ScbR family autoregulator-binding transcription factor n=1 Tax=Streptomyces sp. NPDC058092 TaxID=3346336 RepID=UPI0036E55BBA